MAAAGIGSVLVRFAKWLVTALGIYAVTLVGIAGVEQWFNGWIVSKFGQLPVLIVQLLRLCNVPEAAAMLLAANLWAIKVNTGRKLIFRKGSSS